ncbi:hypothetical protein SISSUDRAFT_77109 [Sistotremastrum suecicum HHB10207 ss-3]|uniref:Uncharacterized protein n=1 Tax=Sistotremastrum suecicum HHB10207 ss-3 TaxID=1314776 RepID=A0A166H2H1_9AGAM|nr:hypothetical protein SISSUDRAFT_77109 [Sistotremastrum suecicum HHB10207 ss-3]
MVLEMFIGDAFTIYRTWLLWDQRLLPIIFPAVLLFVLGQWIILMSVTSIVTYPVVIPVSLALNIACLILIAYRLYTHPKLPLPRLFIHTMISTSCLYIILLFYFMITIFTRWHYAIALAGPISRFLSIF